MPSHTLGRRGRTVPETSPSCIVRHLAQDGEHRLQFPPAQVAQVAPLLDAQPPNALLPAGEPHEPLLDAAGGELGPLVRDDAVAFATNRRHASPRQPCRCEHIPLRTRARDAVRTPPPRRLSA